MTKKRRPIPKYNKEFSFFGEASIPCNKPLLDCALEIFPSGDSAEVKAWQEMTYKDKVIEPEPILFMIMVCGAYFRIHHPDVKKTLSDLYKWFTQRINNPMAPDLAKLLIDTLAPGIRKELEKRGYQLGYPKGPNVRQKGRPPKTRGAWAVAIIIKEYLYQQHIEHDVAHKQAVSLASILLGREATEDSEFYRVQKKAPKTKISNLLKKLLEEYDFWLRDDGMRVNDPEPSSDKAKQYSEWKSRHKSLRNSIMANGYETLCRITLSRIPANLLGPFWGKKIE